MKSNLIKILTWAILIAAYSIVFYKLLSYDNYDMLFLYLKDFNYSSWYILFVAVILMPVNIIIESLKWRYAICDIEKITFKHAVWATLIGQVGAIATPNKLGDLPTRSLTLTTGNKTAATILGFIAAWTLPFVIIVVGVFSSYFYISSYNNLNITKNYIIGACVCSVFILTFILLIPKISLFFAKTNFLRRIKSTFVVLSEIKTSKLINFTLLSLLRYVIFSFQFYLLLLFFKVDISLYQAVLSIPTIYLLTTITPSMLASEAVTRSSYAILVLAPFCSTSPTIVISATVLWCLNNGLPLVFGLILFNSKNINF